MTTISTIVFSIALFLAPLPFHPLLLHPSMQVPTQQDQQGDGRRHVKQGPEVGKRVKELMKFNKNIRNALAAFEKNEKRNGNKPKHDASFSVTLDPAGGAPSSAALKNTLKSSPFRKVGFRTQEPDYSGYGVEMIFIPTFDIPGEWQGTVVFNQFDPSGAYLGQYVADVAMGPDPTGTYWDVFYEISYQDGEAYLEYGNLGFEVGTPRDNQAPEMSQPPISGMARPKFQKAGFSTTPQRGLPRAYPPAGPRTRWVMKYAVYAVTAAGVGCGIVSLIWPVRPFGPCWVGSTTTMITLCTLRAIFGA